MARDTWPTRSWPAHFGLPLQGRSLALVVWLCPQGERYELALGRARDQQTKTIGLLVVARDIYCRPADAIDQRANSLVQIDHWQLMGGPDIIKCEQEKAFL